MSNTDTIREALESNLAFLRSQPHAPQCASQFGDADEPCSCGRRKRIAETKSALTALSAQQTYLSDDYEELYELLKAGGEALGWIEGARLSGTRIRQCAEMGRIGDWSLYIRGREHGGSVNEDDKTEFNTECDAFKAECKRLQLQWVAPAPSKVLELSDAETFRRSERHAIDLIQQGVARHIAEARAIGYRDGLREARDKFLSSSSSPSVEAFDKAVAEELQNVSHVTYDSHEICKHFAGKVRSRLSALMGQTGGGGGVSDETSAALSTGSVAEDGNPASRAVPIADANKKPNRP